MKDVIIIPTYNEKENVAVLIPMIFNLLPNIFVVMADDNSPDGTKDVILELQKKYPHISLISRIEKNGLGKAYLNAFSKVLADTDVRTVTMMDADFSPQLKYLPKMLEESKRYGVVIGSRYVAGIEGVRTIGWKLKRRLLSFFSNRIYCRAILPMPIRDFTCGFMVMQADFLRKIDFSKISASGYAFIIELKYFLYKAGATFFEVPIVFIERIQGESKISGVIMREGMIIPWRLILKKYI